MSNLLQIALFLASVAVVTFVAFCIPAILQLRKHTARLARTLEELKAEVSPLVQDGRKLLHNVNELSTRVHRQCDEVEDVIQTVRGWTERADRVVEEVGSVLEPPILTAARNAHIFRKGIAKFFETFLNRTHHEPQNKSEEKHVKQP
jgi:uncharacterized protein YoxC